MIRRIDTDPHKYVVLDLETNGLKAKEDDVLSISLYKPDDGKAYTRFLPLELADSIQTTEINGITMDQLMEKTPLTQSEFDKIIEEYELDTRTILTYSGSQFDERFLREYLSRKGIVGFNRLTFYSIKGQIISSRFSGGNVTKDNLCRLFGIPGVEKVHSSLNDCRLEWELFKKLDGHYYLITEGDGVDKVFKLSPDYIVPVSYLYSHPSLSRIMPERPNITCEIKEIKRFEIDPTGVYRFDTNITGMTIEHLINTMLRVQKVDSKRFLLENKGKLDYVGKLSKPYEIMPMVFNSDGSVTAVLPKHKQKEKEINRVNSILRARLVPLIEFIKTEIFLGAPIKSQELVVNTDYNIFALCDLSSDDAVLEIKTSDKSSDEFKEQLFYEANGRRCYHLRMIWKCNSSTSMEELIIQIHEVTFSIGSSSVHNWSEYRREQQRKETLLKLTDRVTPLGITVLNFNDSKSPLLVKCLNCGQEWSTTYRTVISNSFKCYSCNPKQKKLTKAPSEKQSRIKVNAEKYANRIASISNGKITVLDYKGSNKKVEAQCMVCGYEWSTRADHLIERCYCPVCKQNESRKKKKRERMID